MLLVMKNSLDNINLTDRLNEKSMILYENKEFNKKVFEIWQWDTYR